MVEQWHAPPCWAESEVVVTVGNQDGVAKAIEMLLNPGDFVVVPEPCYSDVLCMVSNELYCRSIHYEIIEITSV